MIKNGFYSKAKLVPSPNKGGPIKPRLIVVHDTAGALAAAGSISWLCNPQSQASAHFVVSREGQVTQLISCNLKAWHAGKSEYLGVKNVNDFSIGIEFVNPGHMEPSGAASARAGFGTVFDRKKYSIEQLGPQDFRGTTSHPAGCWMPYTPAQIDAGLELCLAIKEAYGITDVAPHWLISPRRKIDTNPLFPLVWLQGRLLGRKNEEPIPPLVVNTAEFLKDVTDPAPGGLVRVTEETSPVIRHKVWAKQPTLLRKWPSFSADNIEMELQPGPFFEFIHNGFFYIVGEGVPAYLADQQLEWAKISAQTVDGWIQGWALRNHLTMENDLDGIITERQEPARH